MLREIQSVTQHHDDRFRRWFADDSFDLIVWYNARQEVCGFQLCYEKNRAERALTWQLDKGYAHHRIDSGERSAWETNAPVLLPGGRFPPQEVINSFVANSAEVDVEVVQFVVQKLSDYGREITEAER